MFNATRCLPSATSRSDHGWLSFALLALLLVQGSPAGAQSVWQRWTSTEPNDHLGVSVAVIGSTVIVGAPNSDKGGANASGWAYVAEGERLTSLPLTGLAENDRAGVAVAADDTTGTDVVAVATATSTILTFERGSSGVWRALEPIPGKEYGMSGLSDPSISLHGSRLAVGDPQADGGTGKVFVFARQGDSWQKEKDEPSYTDSRDAVGWSISLGDGLLAATGDEAAYIFSYDGVTQKWSLEGRKDLSSSSVRPSVALDGELLAVGRPFPLNGLNGSTLLFQRHYGGSNSWGQIQELRPTDPLPESVEPPPLGDLFGFSVALQGGRLVVGAPGDDNVCRNGSDNKCNAGSVYIFDRNPSTGMFEKALELTGPGTGYDAWLGKSVALDGNLVVAGAPYHGNGEVHAFDVSVRTADLVVTKTDGLEEVLAGRAVTYTIEVKNLGPGLISGAIVEDRFHHNLGAVTWTCQASEGGSCFNRGEQQILARIDLLPNATVTYTAHATVLPGAKSGSLANTAAVHLPFGMSDPKPNNNLVQDRDILSADCNRNGGSDATDIAAGTSTDLNSNGEPDECEMRSGHWAVYGNTIGGQVTATLQSFSGTCTVTVTTFAGQSSGTVAANLAAAINATCTAQGISAMASDSTVTIQGFVFDTAGSSVTTNDPGLSFALAIVDIPALSPAGLVALTLVLLAAGTWLLRR